MASRHTLALIHEADGSFGISFPDFPGCVSGGASIDEAIARGTATLAFHVAGMIDDGDRLPDLRSYAEMVADPSFSELAAGAVVAAVPVELPGRAVRVNISIDEHLLEAIDRAATAAGKSRSALIAEAARASLKSVA